MNKRGGWLGAVTVLVLLTGCGPSFGPNAANGITFYCPGAGNVDFGDTGIRQGLEAAGYKGQVASILWTVSFNPAIDQALRVNARIGARRLASHIRAYIDEYPGRPVNVVGLSAGSGVALWALEDLPRGYKVDNVVLLASSLYHRYDIRDALEHIEGRIYNYYSSRDLILAGPMKVFGTIDGRPFVDGAGAVGLHPPTGQDRVVNISWRPEFTRYGHTGAHTTATSPAFVRRYIASHITENARDPLASQRTAPPTLAVQGPVVAYQH